MPARISPAPRRNARYTPLDADGPLPLDMVRGVRAIRRDAPGFLARLTATHGDLVAFPMPRTPVLLVNDPAAARRVLVDNARNYGKATIQYRSLALVTGDGLLTTDGDVWRRRRRLAQPAFHHSTLHGVVDASVEAGERLRAATGVVDAEQAALRAMLTVVGRTLFADDLAADGERLVEAVDDALRAVVARAQSPLAAGPLRRLPTPAARRLRRAVRTIDEVCEALVERRRGHDGDDVLALLLHALDGAEVTGREVRDEIVTMVIAGHETVASCLTWTLGLLAAHPEAQRALHAELDEVLGGRPPGWGDLRGLRRTRAVVDEALRLYPPAWIVTRRALGPDTLAGTDVPEGTLVLLSPWLLHRNTATWPDPERFDPDRFLATPRPPGYVPFGAGPRLCIGRDVALTEAVLVLATLLRDRRVSLPDGMWALPRAEALVTLRPRGGLPLEFTPR